MDNSHQRFMRVALQLAARNLGRTWPNPCVGAVVVRDGRIVGQGVTAHGGRPHAETIALAQAGELVHGATLYVTLEPCSHHGKTPPCAEAVVAAGIARVVSAHRDPNPLVSGRGIELLRHAGIDVIEGVREREAHDINRGFFSVMQKLRPFISLKIATSLDGKMATSSGESQWITGERARSYGHALRSRYDAIATGIGTVLADDPLLTCRLPGLEEHSPVRVVFDRNGRLPHDSKLFLSADAIPVWHIISSSRPPPARGQAFGPGPMPDKDFVHVIELEPGLRRDDGELEQAVQKLAERGITRLLIEAGPQLTTAFLQSGLVDRMYWFRAPLIIGNDGLAAAGNGFSPALADVTRWQTVGAAFFTT